MAFSATIASDSSRLRNPISLGPVKMQFMTWTCLSTDTTATVTVPGFIELTGMVIDGLNQSTNITYSGNTATVTFIAPGTTDSVAGDIIALGV